MHKLTVGQTLLFEAAPHSNSRGRGTVTVTAAGRKWAEIEGFCTGRISLDTLEVDGRGYSSPGRCYLSKEDWMMTEGRNRAWDALRSSLQRSPADEVTCDKIIEAASLLGIKVELPQVFFR
jgi:hypothetical protein